MNKPRQPLWYWGVVGLLMLVGAGSWSTSSNRPTAIRWQDSPKAHDAERQPSIEELAAEFRKFRQEVAQLAPHEQQEVWQSLLENTESPQEQTMYAFYALPEEQQQPLVDAVIDRRRRERLMRGGWGGPIREVAGDPEFSRPFEELSLEERLAARRYWWQDATLQAQAMKNDLQRRLEERSEQRGLPPEPMRRYGMPF